MESSLPELLLSGFKLMLIGMGIVYLFLALLVWIIGTTAKLVRRYLPEPETPPIRAGHVAEPPPGEAELVAAMAAAIHRYKTQAPH